MPLVQIPTGLWIVCLDYNVGRHLLAMAGYRLRRRDADKLDLYPEVEGKPTYVGARELEGGEYKPVIGGELTVDEGWYDGTLQWGGLVTTNYRGQELLDSVSVLTMVIRKLKGDTYWMPRDSGCIGRKRAHHEQWVDIVKTLVRHPEWCEQLGVQLTKARIQEGSLARQDDPAIAEALKD